MMRWRLYAFEALDRIRAWIERLQRRLLEAERRAGHAT